MSESIEDLNQTIRNIFEIWIGDTSKYDDYGDHGWKSMMIDLYDLCYAKGCPFSDDACFGFRYLQETIYFTICKKCGDEKAFSWLNEYARRWLEGSTDFPPFPRECYYGKCEYTR